MVELLDELDGGEWKGWVPDGERSLMARRQWANPRLVGELLDG